MDLKKATTKDLLRMLVSRDARKRAWERDSYGSYSDSSDESMLDDVNEGLALRIDGKEQGPEPEVPEWARKDEP